MRVRSLAPLIGLRIPRVEVSCGVGGRSDLVWLWLWLWCRRAAVASIQPLAWESPYATGVAERKKGRKETTDSFVMWLKKDGRDYLFSHEYLLMLLLINCSISDYLHI